MIRKRFKNLVVVMVVLVIGLFTSFAKAGLVASYTFDDGTVSDSSGNKHDGTLFGNAEVVNDPNHSNILKLDGDGSYVNLGNGNWAFSTPSATCCAWIKVDKFTKSFQCLIGNDGTFRLSRYGKKNNLRFWSDGLGGSLVGTSNLNDNKWHHICGVIDSDETNTTLYLYVDGKIENSRTRTESFKPLTTDLLIGTDGAAYPGRDWEGYIDDVLFFDNALDQKEISKLYFQGISKSAPESLKKIIELNQNIERLSLEQDSEKLVVLLENGLKTYEQLNDKKQSDIPSPFKTLLCDLYFTLAKAEEQCNKPKDKIVKNFEKAIQSGGMNKSNRKDIFLGLYKNASHGKYKELALPFILQENNFLKTIVAMPDTITDQQKANESIDFLQANLTLLTNWRQENPFDQTNVEKSIALMYFQLADAKKVIETPKNEIATTYDKAFSLSPGIYPEIQTPALIWMLENKCTDEYMQILKSLIQKYDTKLIPKNSKATAKPKKTRAKKTKNAIPNKQNDSENSIIQSICKYYESKQDWDEFKKFLNTVLTETKSSLEYVRFMQSCISNKLWLTEYLKYIDNNPISKLAQDIAAVNRYEKDGNYGKAIDLYRDLLNRCEIDNEKVEIEYKICKCLFNAGQYSEASEELGNFIVKNRAVNRPYAQNATLMKGRSHIQLGEVNKAIDVFLAMIAEYPESKDSDETTFFIGYCYMLQQKFEEAKEAFETLMDCYPQSPYVSKARIYMTRINNMTK